MKNELLYEVALTQDCGWDILLGLKEKMFLKRRASKAYSRVYIRLQLSHWHGPHLSLYLCPHYHSGTEQQFSKDTNKMKSAAELYIFKQAWIEAQKRGKSVSDVFKVKQLMPSSILTYLFYYSSHRREGTFGEMALENVFL